jgi:hypothetical protein
MTGNGWPGHPGREFEGTPSDCVTQESRSWPYPHCDEVPAVPVPVAGRRAWRHQRAGPLMGDLGWVTSGRVTFRVTCQCSVARGPAARPGVPRRTHGWWGLMEDNAWRRRSVFGFYPLPPTGLSRGGPGQVVLVSGLPGLVIPTK